MAVKISNKSFYLLGKAIQYHRKKARLSRNEFADISGVGKTVIYDIEKGKETVKLNTLLKVISSLNISIFIESPLMDMFEESINETGNNIC